jgi:hypothetical protein
VTSPIVAAVLERLDRPRLNGANRWRAACPACGATNRSTLSVGEGDNGCVLLRCFRSGCEPDVIARAIGLEIEDLFPAQDAYAPSPRRRRMLAAGQALELLTRDATVVVLASAQMRQGQTLSDADHQALLRAAAHFGELLQEYRS